MDDRVKGLQSGSRRLSDKTLCFFGVAARVQALMRRASGLSEPTQLNVGDLSVNLLTRKVSRAGQRIDLQPLELAAGVLDA